MFVNYQLKNLRLIARPGSEESIPQIKAMHHWELGGESMLTALQQEIDVFARLDLRRTG